jgi:hypothetical protein
MATTDLDYIARETQLPFGSDPFGRTVTATLEEIRYAEQLRLQLRQSYACGRDAPFIPWCIGAD